MELKGLVAYPSNPDLIGQTIMSALSDLNKTEKYEMLKSWEENDIPGNFISNKILQRIEEGNILIADITKANFNVSFEIGYAIAKKKRVYLLRNRAIKKDDRAFKIGLFDTLGYESYANSNEFIELIKNIPNINALPFNAEDINRKSPVYILYPKIKTDFETKIASRIKKARLKFRNFDPEEQGRLPADEAIDQTAQSIGIVINLLSLEREGHEDHNIRAAFLAGLAFGMNKALLILQQGNDPVPLDYRDLVKSVNMGMDSKLKEHIAEFSTEIADALQKYTHSNVSIPKSFLARLSLGASAAENEIQDLSHYYIETDEYQRALRGEVQIVTGRKGSGKTALFYRVRDELLKDKKQLIVDLKPEGYQLIKFRNQVLDFLEEGTKEHLITAFWEYVLLLEIAYRIIRSDNTLHLRNYDLFEPYRNVEKVFSEDASLLEGDFAERMLKLIKKITYDFKNLNKNEEGETSLDQNSVTELLYKHDIRGLRKCIADYLIHKDNLWVLIDNIDKGWAAHGVSESDVLTLRGLINAINKIEGFLRKYEIEANGIIFIRNDVYENMVSDTPDRGKHSEVMVDWQDANLLREMLRRRFIHSGINDKLSFDEMWSQVVTTYVEGEESSQYLIDRSLMRPRALLDLLGSCKSRAVNLGNEKIEYDDIINGEKLYSEKLFDDISYELRDVNEEASDILYSLIEIKSRVKMKQVLELLNNKTEIYELLLWYGVFGLIKQDKVIYIYDVNYDIKRLKTLIEKHGSEESILQINPAFWSVLDVEVIH